MLTPVKASSLIIRACGFQRTPHHTYLKCVLTTLPCTKINQNQKGKQFSSARFPKFHPKPRAFKLFENSDSFYTKKGHKKKMGDTEIPNKGYLDAGEHKVYPWAISGLESSIVVRGPQKNDKIAFDMGYAHREAVTCSDVFISHGHMDHIVGIPSHINKRALYSWRPFPTYYVPPNLEAPLTEIIRQFGKMTEEDLLKLCHIKTIAPGESVKVGSRTVKAFPTVHRVKSQGYLVHRHKFTVKPEYADLPGEEKGKLAREGIELRQEEKITEMAYTGDTTFDLFMNPPDPDLLKVKLLITEATYIDHEIKDGKGGVERAESRGHSHLQQFVDNAHLFEDVEKIVLLHFSDKYSIGYIKKQSAKVLEGSPLEDKILIGTTMKEFFP